MSEITFTREKREKLVDGAVEIIARALGTERYGQQPTSEQVDLALDTLRDIHQYEIGLMALADAKTEADEEDTPDGP